MSKTISISIPLKLKQRIDDAQAQSGINNQSSFLQQVITHGLNVQEKIDQLIEEVANEVTQRRLK